MKTTWHPTGLLLLSALVALSARAEAPRRVAVLPVSLLAAPPETGARARARLAAALRDEFEVQLIAPEQIDREVTARCGAPESWWDCLEREENLLHIGRQLEAGSVVASNLAVMGETRVLKLRVVDLSSETVAGETVEMMGANDEAVLERLVALNARLFPRAEAEPAWHQRWQVWTVIGIGAAVVTAAATVAAVYIATADRGEEETWDDRASLP